jgi:Protein of unknown function (DUF3179)
MRRIGVFLIAAALAVTACTGHAARPSRPFPSGPSFFPTPSSPSALSGPGPHRLPQAAVSSEENVRSALDNPTAPGLPRPLVDPKRIIDGGPPPDGIPALADAKFERADTVDWLIPEEPVLSLTLNGETRAYPVQILIFHEIVNDTVGGVPVAVTYCPLCNSAVAFDRRIAGRVVTFGTSGKLLYSNLVMYDRQTRSLWPQLAGQAVAGVLTGTRLTAYPVQTLAWQDWLADNPHAWVLSNQTGYDRSYGFNPYGGYDQPNSQPFDLDRPADPRLPPKTRIVALGGDHDPVAITLDTLTARHVITLRVAGQNVVIWALPGLRSALDMPDLEAGRTIAATGALDPHWHGRLLHFTPRGTQFIDAETGSHWTVLGRAVGGPARGARLQTAHYTDTFWFAWAAYQPHTRIVR